MSDLCPVAVAQDSTEDENQPETAAESHLLLLKQKKYCDVTFTFSNLPNRIQAHEVYLKALSPVFAKIFRMRKSGNVEGNEIEISESTPEIFQQFLEFIYADKFEVDITEALDLLHLAQKYKVNPLIKKCEQLLLTEILEEDSVKIFETARRYSCLELMDRSGQIMIKYTNMDPNEFTKLVVPTGLLSAEQKLSVYVFLCGDEITRRDLKIKFDTSPRNGEMIAVVEKNLGFHKNGIGDWFPAFSKHSIRSLWLMYGREHLWTYCQKSCSRMTVTKRPAALKAVNKVHCNLLLVENCRSHNPGFRVGNGQAMISSSTEASD